MTITLVDTDLLADLQRFGAGDVSACYSCGTCTATCPLVDDDATFPRRLIRYAEVGLRDELLGSKELWTCYHCGLCSDACPTQADPAGFMAAARRYAVARYDRTRLADTLYTRPAMANGIVAALVLLFGAFMYGARGPQEAGRLALFTFVPYELIHWTGVGVMVLVLAAALSGLVTMIRSVAVLDGTDLSSLVVDRQSRATSVQALWDALAVESLGQRRFREDCHDQAPPEPLYRRRWLVHALTIWGFLGLLTATVVDYGLDLMGVKPTGTSVALWYPTRLLGTAAGLSLVYGVTMFAVDRIRGISPASRNSTASDWLLLGLLWVTGLTGFLLEIALYVPGGPGWGYWVFLVHVAVAMVLLLLLPFTKLAHVVYRPVALFFHALARRRREASEVTV